MISLEYKLLYFRLMRNFRDLVAWQKSIELCLLTYDLTKELPKEEEYGLKSQLRRASVSIPSNLAEGSGKRSIKDYCRFVQISLGSCSELETQLELVNQNIFHKKKV